MATTAKGRPARADCELCGGTGFRLIETTERSFRTRCSCFEKSSRERLLARAGVPPGLRHCTLDSWEPMRPKLKRAGKLVREFLDTWPLTGPTGLLFHGPVGTGKTHLAIAIVMELLLEKKADARFLDFRKLLKTIQESYNPEYKSSEKQLLDRLLAADLLALDDLGAEKPSEWVRETIGYIINERYTRGKPVVITTNLRFDVGNGASSSAGANTASTANKRGRGKAATGAGRASRLLDTGPETLGERIGAAALSRLYEMCKPVDLEGVPDYRKTVKLYGAESFG